MYIFVQRYELIDFLYNQMQNIRFHGWQRKRGCGGTTLAGFVDSEHVVRSRQYDPFLSGMASFRGIQFFIQVFRYEGCHLSFHRETGQEWLITRTMATSSLRKTKTTCLFICPFSFISQSVLCLIYWLLKLMNSLGAGITEMNRTTVERQVDA